MHLVAKTKNYKIRSICQKQGGTLYNLKKNFITLYELFVHSYQSTINKKISENNYSLLSAT